MHGVIVVVSLFFNFCIDVNILLDFLLSLISSAILLILDDLLTGDEY